MTLRMIRLSALGFLALTACAPSETEPQPAPVTAVARQESALLTAFAAGSLIIPMDTASQDRGTLRAFGLVDRLLRINVPVHRVALTGKAAGAIDFTVATATQQEDAGVIGPINYRAGPFVIAAADVTPAALAVVNAYLAADLVTNVHVATAPFSADVRRTLVAAPRIAVLRDGNEDIAYQYLNNANILDSAGNAWSNTSPGSLLQTSVAGAAAGGALDGALISGGQPAFDQLTSMHYDNPVSNEVVREVRGWLSLGPTTHGYMQCSAISAFENNVNGHFLTDGGIQNDNDANPDTTLVPDSLFAQFDGAFTVDTGAIDSMALVTNSKLFANSSLLIAQTGAPFGTKMVWLTGHIDGDTNKGKISYLSGHDYSVNLPISTNPQTNGVRLFLNGLYETPGLFASDQPAITVTKTAPVTTSANNFTFTIAYTNAGPGAVFNASLVDVLPPGTTFVSATGGGVNAAGTVTWPLGTLARSASGSVTVTVSAATEGTYLNRATLNYRVGLTQKSALSNQTSTLVDRTVPDTTLSTTTPSLSNSAAANFTFTSTEAGTFECSLDAAAFAACTTPLALAGLTDGSHTFRVRARDAALNVDPTPASFTWTVDTTVPDTTLTSTPPAASNSSTASFTFTSTEAGTFECSLDGAAFAACTTPRTITGLADGSHTFQVRARDGATNVDPTPASFTWVVDTLAPDTTLTSTPPALTNSSSAAFSFTSSEAGTLECSLDGAAFVTCTSPVALTGLGDGSHTFQVRGRDAAGNVDATPASFGWTIDSAPPDTTITSGPAPLTNATTASITFTSTEPGTFACSLDGAAFAACTTPLDLSGLTDGSHTLLVRAVDGVGNIDSTPASHTWTIDTVAPNTTLSGAPSGTTNVSTASLTFTSNEAGSTFECSLDGAAFSACTTPASLTALSDGPHTFSVRAIDAAGNVDSTPATATWTVDAAVPDTVIATGPTGSVNVTDATFTFTSTKPSSTFECSVDGAAFASCATPNALTGLADGSHTFEVRATDPVGNVDPSPATRTWIIDTQAPDTTITLRPVALTNDTSAHFQFTSPEAAATFQCSLDGAAWATCASPFITSGTLADGVHVMLVRAGDAAGNVDLTPASASWEVDTVAPPAPSITEPVADSTTGALPRFGGFSEPGATVTVTISGMTVCTSVVALDGRWSCSASTALALGTQTATATATDGAGNVSMPSLPRGFTVDSSKPDTAILTGPGALTKIARADFTVSSDASGATFECSLDGAPFAACTASPSFVVTDGSHSLAVRAVANGVTDASPATRTWTLDTTAPNAPVITSPTANGTTSATPTFTGTSEPGSTVVISLDGQPLCTAVTNATGTFSCSGTSALPPGAHTANAVATDPAGNPSQPSADVPFTVGSTTLDTAIIAGPSGTVRSTSAGFAFTSTVVGATFECSLDGAAFTACPTPITFTGLAAGSHTLQVRAVDGANVDTTPASRTWIIDATAPTGPTVTAPADQSTIRTRTPRYVGTAEPGSTVTVSVDDRQVCTAIADSTGAWSCTGTFALADGNHRVAAVATDGAGNVSPASMTNRFTIDIPEMTVVIVAPVMGAITNDSTPTINGTSTAGATVSVFVDGMLLGTAVADSNGAWTLTPTSPISDGMHVVTARAELGGLMSPTSAVTVTIDTRAPVVTVTLTQENPQTIPEVTFSGDESQLAFTCSLDGGAFVPCSSPFDLTATGEGEHTLVVRATDAAGNTGEATRTWTVTAPTEVRVEVRGGGCGCASTDGVTGVLAGLMLLVFAARRSRRGLLSVKSGAALALVLAAQTASAQVAGFDLERLDLNPGATASLISGTGDVMRKGAWRASLVLHYQHDPLVLYRQGTDERLGAVVGSRFTTHLVGAWTPLDWLEVGVQLPIVVYQGGTDLSAYGVGAVATPAVGTPWLTGRFAFLRESAGSPLDLAVQIGLGLPFGSAAAFTNTTPIAFAPRVGAGKSVLKWLRIGGEVGLMVRGAAEGLKGAASAFTFALSATTKGPGLRGEVTFRGAVALDDASFGGDLLAGGRYPLGKWLEVFLLGGPGLGQLPGNPAFRVLGGLAVQPPEPEKAPLQLCDDSVSLAVLRTSCSTLDADGDGITNGVDACPRVAGVAAARGCPMPDTDDDGLTDDVDECPKEKGPRARKGCPIRDQDDDGVEDAVDACVKEPGPVERKGCPVRDADLDGVEDEVDACPAEAGPVERKGCPLKDQDGDTVEDALDNCPTEKGPVENAGCPLKVKQLVIITKDKLVIQEKVFFATAKSQVLPRSFKLLDNVAQVLIAHPEIELVRIEGHTDSQGVAAKNVALSQARAEAVKAQLVKRKVPAERLKAIGFGPDKPTAPNDTAAGREQNRRVEFNFEAH